MKSMYVLGGRKYWEQDMHRILQNVLRIGCSTQTGQHEHCKRECCPVWVLQYRQMVCSYKLGNLATSLYEPRNYCIG